MSVYLLAGGGTAGHVNPLLATADALRESDPEAEILVLGTAEGLESRLVPARGYELVTIPKAAMPRRPNVAALKFPARFWAGIARARTLIHEREVAVVAGFGGFASTPAYLAARNRVPVVVHEANAMPGLANKLGARWAAAVGVTFPNTDLPHAQLIGMPLRAEIVRVADERAATRAEAIAAFGLDPNRKTLLVTGGSQGARRINETVREVAEELTAERAPDHGDATPWQVLHIVGRLSPFVDPEVAHYHVLEYCDRMELALGAADLVISRAGASTVAEIAALGLPAVYVPYAVGNGEQAVNISSLIDADAARMISDAEFTPQRVRADVLPLMRDAAAREELAARAARSGITNGAQRLADLIRAQIAPTA